MQRWIIHIDMDAFFAAVEQRDNPELRGKPVIVGGLGRRGVVSTASYEARRFGVHSALPMIEARRRCPHGIYLPGSHRRYAEVSAQIRAILSDYSPLIEPLSLDEAFLDISGMDWLFQDPMTIAKTIKERIRSELGLTASAGVAPNKFLAKLASDLRKPDGLVLVRPGEEAAFLKDIPIGRLWGIGEKTAEILERLGIHTIGQLARTDPGVLARQLGNSGEVLLRLAQGLDDRPVVPESDPKSIGNEVTFETDLRTYDELETVLMALVQKVGRRIRKCGLTGRTVTVKLRFASFKTLTRSKTMNEPTHLDDTVYDVAKTILRDIPLTEGVRLLGVTLSHLHASGGQTLLFCPEDESKKQQVCSAVDRLRDRFGEGVITRGRLLPPGKKE